MRRRRIGTSSNHRARNHSEATDPSQLGKLPLATRRVAELECRPRSDTRRFSLDAAMDQADRRTEAGGGRLELNGSDRTGALCVARTR